MSDYKIAVCMPMARGVSPHTMRSLLACDIPKPWHLFDPVGFQIDHARNRIVHEVLNFALPDVTHFMWIDDDMVFDRASVRRLLAHDLPIVGGLCHNRRHPYHPILLHYNDHGFTFRYDYPEGLIEVDGAGSAFILVKAEVYKAINDRFGGVGPYTPLDVSEDLSFCKRARACGYKIMVDTTVKIGHVGEVIVDEAFARRNREFEARPYHEAKPMPAGEPVASIIIPTYNQRPEFLRMAIASALTQTVPVEVLVIDNGSTSCPWCDTPNAERKPSTGVADHPRPGACSPACQGAPDGVRLFWIPTNPGHPWDALNIGIRAMHTPWFTWLSSDDLFYPPKIERQREIMATNGWDLSAHAYDRIGEHGEVISLVIAAPEWKTMKDQRTGNATGCSINGLTAMISRDALEAVRLPSGDYFDTSYVVSADWELWNRLGTRRMWHAMRDVLATRREFGDNATARYQRDPAMRAVWSADDARIRSIYGVRP